MNIKDIIDYWDASPCNVGHSHHPIGSRKYFDEVRDKKYVVEPHIISFSEFPRWKGKNVLEIGCGMGTMAVDFIQNGATYVGIDVSSVTIELAKKRLDTYGLSGKLILGNAEELAKILPSQNFDLIYAFGSIHHMLNPQRFLEQVKNYMSLDSTLKLMIYAKCSWKAAMIREGMDQYEAQSNCPIAKTYSRSEAENLLNEFDIIKMSQDHIFPYDVANYKRNKLVKLPWFEVMPQDVFSTLEKQLGWHLLIDAKVKKHV